MDFTKLNKNQFKKIDWGKDTKGFTFKKISDLYSEGITKVQVFGFFFTKSPRFGLQPNAILADCLLNLPTHQKDTISDLIANDNAVEEIKKGNLSLSFREYESKYNKTCYEIEFCNTEKTQSSGNAESPLF